MRVLHVIDGLDPRLGGVAAVVPRLAAAQARLGATVTVLSRHEPEAAERIAQATAQIPGLELVTVRNSARPETRLGAFYSRVDPAEHASIADADAVHLHGLWSGITRRCAQAARRLGVPYLIAPHGMLDPWSLAQSKWKKRAALALGWRALLRRAAAVHALTDTERRWALRLCPGVPAEVIPNGVFPQELEPMPAPGEFRQQRPELADGPLILFLSRLHHKKGLDLLLAAFATVAAEHPSARLVIAGPDGGALAKARHDASSLGLTDRALFVGPLYGRQKLAALADAAVFCLPSRQEGFSVAITEALAVGVPVVATHACNYPEVEQAGAGLLTDLEPSQIARALLRVLGSAQDAAAMRAAGKRLVAERFTWPVIARRSLDAYGRAVARSHAGRTAPP